MHENQILDFRAQIRVKGARAVKKDCSLARVELERRMKEFLNKNKSLLFFHIQVIASRSCRRIGLERFVPRAPAPLIAIGIAILVGIIFACILTPILCGMFGLGAASSINAFRQGGANILTGLFVLLGPTLLIVILLGLLLGTLANVFTSSVWTLAYREWNKPGQPAEAALQPVAPPIEPLPCRNCWRHHQGVIRYLYRRKHPPLCF